MCWSTNKRPFLSFSGNPGRRIACLLLPAILVFGACASSGEPGGSGLFAMDSLLGAQASRLSAVRASLHKQTTLGLQRGEVTLTPPDSTAWKKELEAFLVMDAINKPVNRGRYAVNDTGDRKSNLRVRSFTTTADLPVKYVHIYYYREPSRIRKIEASYHESNALYRTTRLLTMQFEIMNNTPVMTSYAVQGGQKMFLDDTVRYDVRGRVKLEN